MYNISIESLDTGYIVRHGERPGPEHSCYAATQQAIETIEKVQELVGELLREHSPTAPPAANKGSNNE